MKEINRVANTLRNAVILILLLFTACEDAPDDLLDPDLAGVWTLINTSSGIPSNQIVDIERDAENNLWVAFSGNGVGKYRNGKWTYYRTDNSSILSDAVTSLAATAEGGMMVGTTNGVTTISSSGTWSSYKDPAVSVMSINAIDETSDGTIWLGTEAEGIYVDDGTGYTQVNLTPYKNVNAITGDIYGNVFLGTDNGLLKYTMSGTQLITTAGGLPDNDVTALYIDSKERLWIGTNGGKTVACMDNSMNINQISLMNGDDGTFVEAIYEDRRGHIWFATLNDGLIEYDGVVPHSYKEYNGFYEDNVTSISDDEYGNLWIGLLNKGLVRFTLPIE